MIHQLDLRRQQLHVHNISNLIGTFNVVCQTDQKDFASHISPLGWRRLSCISYLRRSCLHGGGQPFPDVRLWSTETILPYFEPQRCWRPPPSWNGNGHNGFVWRGRAWRLDRKQRGHRARYFKQVCIVVQGSLYDSSDDSTVGDVQWMTAGHGIIHNEFHSANFAKTGGTMEMMQLWLVLST